MTLTNHQLLETIFWSNWRSTNKLHLNYLSQHGSIGSASVSHCAVVPPMLAFTFASTWIKMARLLCWSFKNKSNSLAGVVKGDIPRSLLWYHWRPGGGYHFSPLYLEWINTAAVRQQFRFILNCLQKNITWNSRRSYISCVWLLISRTEKKLLGHLQK